LRCQSIEPTTFRGQGQSLSYLYTMPSPKNNCEEDQKPAAADIATAFKNSYHTSHLEPLDKVNSTTQLKAPPFASLERSSVKQPDDEQRSVASTVDIESDEAIARALQESLRVVEGGSVFHDDEALAEIWQKCLADGHPSYRIDEALRFSQRLQELHQDLVNRYGSSNPAYKDIKPVPPMFAITRLLQAQEAFHMDGKSSEINLGSHHTKKAYMKNIRNYGLLTRKERGNVGLKTSHTGRIRFGDGIMTLHSLFGRRELDDSDTGLIVARLYGKSTQKFDTIRDVMLRKRAGTESQFDTQINELVAILKRSSQTLPLMEYPITFAADPSANYREASSNDGARALQIVQKHVQELVDELLNDRSVVDHS